MRAQRSFLVQTFSTLDDAEPNKLPLQPIVTVFITSEKVYGPPSAAFASLSFLSICLTASWPGPLYLISFIVISGMRMSPLKLEHT